jgi:O-antigen/teichoic acid export membrane protein
MGYIMIGGMGIALPRYLSIYRVKKDTVGEKTFFTASSIVLLGLSIFLLILLFLFRQPITCFIFDNNVSDSYFIPLVLYAFALCITAYLFSFFRGNGNYIMFNMAQLIVQGIMLAGCLLVFKGVSFLFYVWSSALILYALYFLIREWWKNRNYWVFIKPGLSNALKQLMRYGMPRMAGDFLLFSFAAFPIIMVNRQFNLMTTGLFSAAIMINTMITPLFSFVGTILLQRTSESYASKNLRPMFSMIRNIMCLFIVFATIAALIITFAAPFILSIFFDHNYVNSSSLCAILSWSLLPQSIYFLLRNPIDALSVFPYNTVSVGIGFGTLVVGSLLVDTIHGFCFVYLLAHLLLALLTLLSWIHVKKQSI